MTLTSSGTTVGFVEAATKWHISIRLVRAYAMVYWFVKVAHITTWQHANLFALDLPFVFSKCEFINICVDAHVMHFACGPGYEYCLHLTPPMTVLLCKKGESWCLSNHNKSQHKKLTNIAQHKMAPSKNTRRIPKHVPVGGEWSGKALARPAWQTACTCSSEEKNISHLPHQLRTESCDK